MLINAEPLPSHAKRNGDSQYSDLLTSALILAVERLDGYVIEKEKNMPYIMVVLQTLLDLRWCTDKELQLANVLRVLFNQGLATSEEIEERFGKKVMVLIREAERVAIEQEEDNTRGETVTFKDPYRDAIEEIKRSDWKQARGIFSCVSDTALLCLLSAARKLHDEQFLKDNPPPKRVTWIREKNKTWCDTCISKCKSYGDRYANNYKPRLVPPGRDYDAVSENQRRRNEYPWYMKRGYIYVSYACPGYERDLVEGYIVDDEYQSARYDYTLEYMAYCDRCSETFWQRYGLTSEEARTKLETFFPRIKTYDEVNDFLYYLILNK